MSTTELHTPLYTVRQFSERHQWISEGGLRWLLFRRDSNGLEQSGAIIKIGRKLLIDEQQFLKWLRCQSQGGVKAVRGGRPAKSANDAH